MSKKLDAPSGIIRAELAKLILLAISFFMIFLMWGCSTPSEIMPVEPTTTLKPYSPPSSTPSRTQTAPTITAQPTAGPTATPFVHIVKKDDTLLGIAIRYGVSLDEILAANPGINPTILSIGQQVIIPGPEGDSQSNFLPVATPIPLQFSKVQCFPTTTKHLWCISTLHNQEGFPLEAVSVNISLLNEKGEVLESKLAFSPLNCIPDGGVIPLSALFPLSPGEYEYAIVLPISAYPAENAEGRYLPIEIKLGMTDPGEDRKSWYVEGILHILGEEEKNAKRVTVLGVALDEEGGIIGFRQLDFVSEIKVGDELPFELEIFSLGPSIDRIEIFTEGLISVGVE